MTFGKIAIAVAIAFALAGCGAAKVIGDRNAENERVKAQWVDEWAEITTRCKLEMSSSDLDSIRDKVELTRNSPTAPTPVALMVDSSVASEIEKPAILEWSLARDRCQGWLRDYLTALPLPTSMNGDLQQQVRSGLVEHLDGAAQASNYLIAALYDGQLTYGQFNTQRDDEAKREFDSLKQWLAVMDAVDKQQTLAQAQSAQQQLNAFVKLAHDLACAEAKGAYAQAVCSQ